MIRVSGHFKKETAVRRKNELQKLMPFEFVEVKADGKKWAVILPNVYPRSQLQEMIDADMEYIPMLRATVLTQKLQIEQLKHPNDRSWHAT